MVLPEGAPSPKTGRPARWKLGGIVAASFLTAAAALVLLNSTAPVPESAQTTIGFTTTTDALLSPTTSSTTTTIDFENFTIGAIATGERLSWFRAPTFVSGWPIALVPHDGQMWLFIATSAARQSWSGAGLSAWVSSDGIEWRSMGVVASEEFSVTGVEAVGDRMVAVGSRLSDGTPFVWVSRDGSGWTVSSLPIDADVGASRHRTWLTGVAGVGESLYLSGFVEPDWQAEIVDLLPPEVAEYVVHNYGLGYSDLGDGVRSVEVYGPLGIIVFSATMTELGVDPETASRAFDGSPTDTSYIWSSENGRTWSDVKLEGLWVQEITALPDASLFVNAGDFRGNGIWVSRDGSNWERLSSGAQMRLIGTWNGKLLAGNDLDLLVSSDGDDWESLGTDELLPWPLYWQLNPVATGEAGLAVIASTWPENSSRQPTTVTVNRDGSTLTFDPTIGEVTVSDGEHTVSVPLWTGTITDVVEIDFATDEIDFIHPETREVVGTFTPEDLRRSETTAFGYDPGVHGLLHTKTGDQWSIIDLAEGIGPQSRVLMMEYLGDQLVMVTTSSFPSIPEQPLRFSVRVASLP